jgi:glycosyltransferase involved in cell wall biosynthesis
VRILMIAPEPFLEPRGTPFSVYHRAKALVTLGYEVDLVTYPVGEEVRLPGLRVFRAPALPFIRKVRIGPSLAKFPLDLCLFLTAIWRLSCGRYRYIHTHEEAGLMGVLLAALFGCRHLYDMHSDLSQQMSNFAFTQNRLLIRCVEALQKLIVRRADVVIVICPDLEQIVKRIAPAKPVYMIENVAVDEALPPAQESDVALLRQRLRLGTAPVLLYTGTFESYQGIELLLRSVALVRPTFPDARYVLVGGKPEQVERQRLLARQLGIDQMVCFVGERPLAEMPLYMALADILLSPRSQGTNTPLKLYTYLRSGKPILATDIHSHSQILTPQMAMLVAPAPEELARGALELLQSRELAGSLGECGRSIAEKNYSWPVFLQKNGRAYSQFMGLRRDDVTGLGQVVEQ